MHALKIGGKGVDDLVLSGGGVAYDNRQNGLPPAKEH